MRTKNVQKPLTASLRLPIVKATPAFSLLCNPCAKSDYGKTAGFGMQLPRFDTLPCAKMGNFALIGRQVRSDTAKTAIETWFNHPDVFKTGQRVTISWRILACC